MEAYDNGKRSEGHTAVASGYLYKIAHNGSIFAKWHRRYYVLYSDGLLFSYVSDRAKSSNRTIPVGRMCLRMKFGDGTSSEDCRFWPKRGRNLCFSVINSDRSYHFFCDSEKELNSWRQHLLGTLGKLASSSNWVLAEREESGAADQENEGAANLVPHSLLQTEVGAQTGGEAATESPSSEEKLPYDAVGPATSLAGVVGGKGGGDCWSLDRSSEGSRASTSGENTALEENFISVKNNLERSSEEEESDTGEESDTEGESDNEEESDIEEALRTQGRESCVPPDCTIAPEPLNAEASPVSCSGRIAAAPRVPRPPADSRSGQPPQHISGEHELLLTHIDTESEPSGSEDEDDESDPTLERHASRSSSCNSSVKNSSSSHSDAEGTQEDRPPAIVHLEKHKQDEVTKAEAALVQETVLTITVRPEEAESEAPHPTDCENSALESSGAAAAIPPPYTEDQPPTTARKEEHATETPSVVSEGAEAFERPAEARPPSPAEEDEEFEDPGPLPVRQRMKRFSEPSQPVSPSNVVFSVGQLARHPQSYPQLSRLEEKEEGEEKQDRVAAAVGWIDKELRKLIAEIQRLGSENEAGQSEVKFGLLFEETANTFEALSGILRTAKKHKVVSYSGELLFQGVNDHTPITLLRTEVEDASLDKYTTANPRGMKRTDLNPDQKKKTSGFGNPTQLTANCKCFICGKRVYAMEFVAANEYTFHKSCFRCLQCSKPLSPGSYATINDKFYCNPHYERLYKERGGYGAL